VQHEHARAWQGWRGQALPLGARRPQTPARPQRIVVRVIFYSPGCVLRDRAAVEGFPWPGRRRGRAGSEVAPLACIWPLRFSVLGRPRNVISVRSCVKARLLPLRSSRALRAALTPAHSDWLRRVRTENKTCSAQPLNGQGSVEHLLAHPLFGGHGKPSRPCVALQHTALRTTPQQKTVSFGLSRFARDGRSA